MRITEQDIAKVRLLVDIVGDSVIKRTRELYTPESIQCVIASNLEFVINNFYGILDGTNRKDSTDILQFILSIGLEIGRLSIFDPDHAEPFQKTLAAIAGRHSVTSGRWERIEAIKQSLIAQAEAKCNDGDLLLHNEMADELLEDNPEAAKAISKPVLLAALKPVAAKYGKVRGVKGIRKEKLPPK